MRRYRQLFSFYMRNQRRSVVLLALLLLSATGLQLTGPQFVQRSLPPPGSTISPLQPAADSAHAATTHMSREVITILPTRFAPGLLPKQVPCGAWKS